MRLRGLVGMGCACAALGALSGCTKLRRRARGHAVTARVAPLPTHRRAPHADGRRGDLVLTTDGDLALTVATSPDTAGHRPLRGAVVDIGRGTDDTADALLWWRPAWALPDGAAHPFVADTVERTRCPGGAPGIAATGTIDGVTLRTQLCAARGGATLHVEATGLPPGAMLFDEINPGSATALVEGRGDDWEGATPTRSVVVAERGMVLRWDSPEATTAQRGLVHIAGERFPAALRWTAPGPRYTRRVRAWRGDALDGIALGVPADTARVFDLEAPEAALPATLTLYDPRGAALLTAPMTAPRRRVVLPTGFGDALGFSDARGLALPPWPLHTTTPAAVALRAEAPAAGTVDFAVTRRDDGAALPVKVMLRGLGRTPDPTPRALEGGPGFTEGRALYLLQGRGRVALAPGRYAVTVTRGPGWTAHTTTLTVTPDGTARVEATLHRVVPDGWTAADLHLHMEMSPDSTVSLPARVGALACNGVEFAIATDHNRVTDLAATVRAAGLDNWLTILPGAEVTSAGTRLWGHFNAFPLVPADDATSPEAATPPYYGVAPQALFQGVRAMGATVLQVNHPRMAPRIGYFDLAGFDPATGSAGSAFAEGFDAVEVFNGLWLESPAQVRTDLVDLVALGRRGVRVTATGNSDSHRVLFQEAGWPVTWVQTAPTPRETLGARVLSTLRAGMTAVSSGPFVQLTVNDTPPGGTVRPASGRSVTARVRVFAPAWVSVDRVELWRDDATVQTLPITAPPTDGLRWEGTVDIPVSQDAAVLAWVVGDAPLPDVLPLRAARAIGFTTPVWVDADGDGRVRLPPRATAATP